MKQLEKNEWYFINDTNKEEKCGDDLNQIFNKLGIGSDTTYTISKWEYTAKKLNSSHIEQTNNKTKTKRKIYLKSSENNKNRGYMSNDDNKEIDEKKSECDNNDTMYCWAFINEDNVLIEPNDKYQTFLDSLTVKQTGKHGNYSVEKISQCQAKQTNVSTKRLRYLFLVLNKNKPRQEKVCIDKLVGVEMIRELFFRSVNGNSHNIDKIEQINYNDEDLYHNKYKKYAKKYSQGKSIERWLFHGTDSKILKQIEINGFDRNFNKTSAFGKV